MKKFRRMLALALAVLGLLTGCAGAEPGPGAETAPAAKGRYVEQDVPLPPDVDILDMVMLTDGRLRLAAENIDGAFLLYTSTADRSGWDQPLTVKAEALSLGYVESLALSPDGSAFFSVMEQLEGDMEQYQPHFLFLDPDGTTREVPVTYPELDPETSYLSYHCDYTADGRLYAQFYFQEIREIDPATGALGENVNPFSFVHTMSCAGSGVYMVGLDSVSIYQDGEAQPAADTLGSQLASSLKATEGYSPKLTFWENADGYLFFTTHDGLYSRVPGGSVTEELVSGGRSSLGDPTFFPLALTGAEDGTFYVLGSSGSGPALYRYVFDPEAPTVPDIQLRLYTLYEDEDLRQMISQYQKANPDVAIDLEVGLTGEDAVTEADAIRALNTQILAGNGPDLVELDGFSLDAYLEKGLLADLTEVLPQAGPLLEQVTGCFERDGKISAVPTAFALPAIYGPGHIVSQIHDLDSLVTAATQAQGENTQTASVFSGFLPMYLADMFYDCCSAAWVRPDGTLEEEKLTAYYTAMLQLYDLDAPYRETIADALAEAAAEGGYDYTPGAYTGLSGAMVVCMGNQCLTPGTLHGMDHWARVLAGDDLLEGYETAFLDGQASGVFLPRRIMGILNTSAHPEAASEFLLFMLSDQVQAMDLSNGFPVNRTVFDREIDEDRVSNMVFSSSDGDGNYLEVEGQYPDRRRRQALKEWVDGLTTPALTDRIIRNMVMEQIPNCLNHRSAPEESAKAALRNLNLYLSE